MKLKYWQPYKDELDGLHQNIEELALREKELDGLIATSVANINQLQAQYDKQEAAILANANKLLEAKQQEIDETTKKLTEIEKLLSRTKGSLYEWLKENKHEVPSPFSGCKPVWYNTFSSSITLPIFCSQSCLFSFNHS